MLLYCFLGGCLVVVVGCDLDLCVGVICFLGVLWFADWLVLGLR